MRIFAEMIKVTLGVPCIDADLVDVEPDTEGLQFECVVSQISDQVESLLPHCPEGATGDLPCWHLVEDRSYCPLTPTGMHLAIERSGVSIAPGSHVIARCRTE
jgi:hypothetical protein